MSLSVFEQLHKERLISDLSLAKVKTETETHLFSIHRELKTILYLGILCLTAGLGILVYTNLDSIGHEVILLSIILLCAGCFIYCFRTRVPFSAARVQSPNAYFDYVLLLGCLLFLTLIAYLQAQYQTFGQAYGMATFIPMVVLFFCAYYFDHLGILSLAITNLAAWLGIAVTPLRILKDNDFSSGRLIVAAAGLGILLTVAAYASTRRQLKPHFSFTFLNFGMNVLYIACLAGMFQFSSFYLLWFLALAAVGIYFYQKAIAEKSFYFILMLSIYGYIAITYVVFQWLIYGDGLLSFILLYFTASGTGLVFFLIHMNKKLRRHDSV